MLVTFVCLFIRKRGAEHARARAGGALEKDEGGKACQMGPSDASEKFGAERRRRKNSYGLECLIAGAAKWGDRTVFTNYPGEP